MSNHKHVEQGISRQPYTQLKCGQNLTDLFSELIYLCQYSQYFFVCRLKLALPQPIMWRKGWAKEVLDKFFLEGVLLSGATHGIQSLIRSVKSCDISIN